MRKTLRIVPFAVVALLAFSGPESAFAQRSGHVGVAGFNGPGSLHGGFHRGGTYFAPSVRAFQGGFHGGVNAGWHGGFHGHNGWYGRWGWGGWGWGFGFGIGFGWPYWPGYAYPYGCAPWWGGPCYYPYYAPRYPYPGTENNGPRPPNSGPQPNNSSPSNHWRPPDRSSPGTDSITTTLAALAPTTPLHTTDATISNASYHRRAHPAMEQFASPRKEVQNAIRALREMPPYAWQREIDNGRFGHFSPEEREFLRSLDP